MTDAALIGMIVSILCLVVVVLVTKLSFKNAERAYSLLNSVHERQSKQLDSVLDRLMTIDWEKFAALQTVSVEGDEGFFAPEEPPTTKIEAEPVGVWGALRDLRLNGERASASAEEQALLDEDFPDEDEE